MNKSCFRELQSLSGTILGAKPKSELPLSLAKTWSTRPGRPSIRTGAPWHAPWWRLITHSRLISQPVNCKSLQPDPNAKQKTTKSGYLESHKPTSTDKQNMIYYLQTKFGLLLKISVTWRPWWHNLIWLGHFMGMGRASLTLAGLWMDSDVWSITGVSKGAPQPAGPALQGWGLAGM